MLEIVRTEPKTMHRAKFALLSLLAACQPAPLPDLNMPTTDPAPGEETVVLHQARIERAYSLEDPREQAFRDQIRADALVQCGHGGYALYAQRPIGPEVIGEDFLYRLYEVTFACDR
jgi:hypothetical protein